MKTPNSLFTEKPLSLILEEAQNSRREQEDPTQEMLDYHDRVAREAGLYDDLPDDFAPAPQTQQPVQVAGGVIDFHKEVTKNLPKPQKQSTPPPAPVFAWRVPETENAFYSATQALDAIAPTLRRYHENTGLEHGVIILTNAQGDFALTPVYKGPLEGEIDLDQIPIPQGWREAARAHSHFGKANKIYATGSSQSDKHQVEKYGFTSYVVGVDEPVMQILADRDEPVFLDPAEIYFDIDYVNENEKWNKKPTADKAPSAEETRESTDQ